MKVVGTNVVDIFVGTGYSFRMFPNEVLTPDCLEQALQEAYLMGITDARDVVLASKSVDEAQRMLYRRGEELREKQHE